MFSYSGFFSGTLCACLAAGIAVSSASFGQEAPEPAKPIVAAASALPDSPVAQPEALPSSSSNAASDPASGPNADNASSGSATSGVARIGGTVMDTNGDVVPGATVTLDGPGGTEHRTITADDNAGFEFNDLKPGVPYHLTVSAKGFVDWKSSELRLHNGDFQFVSGIQLPIMGAMTSVTVTAGTQVEIATQQVYIEEQQRVLGFIPNFYVVYDSKNAVPMTTKLKFQMAYKVLIDPVTLAGSAFLAAINQAADTPDYQQGWKGYGQRFGAVYAGGVTDILFGGAILPTILHQDPRYYYQGTGTAKSRTLHALAAPFVCKGDNGRWQPNYSSLGGDLIASGIQNAYLPPSNRGAGTTLGNFAIDTAEREVSTVIQEFIVRKLTPSAKRQN